MAFEFELPPAPTENIKVNFGEADLVRRSASAVPAPARKLTEVAKLIDVSKCIGCKACQVACLEWNDRTERIGFNYGVYDNPVDLTAESFTVMRFTEWVNPESQNLEWLIRKDGCMHCEDPGCLKACPAPGAIVQYSNGIVDFDHDKCIGCGYCIKGCPFDIPRISAVDHKAYKCTLCSDRVAVGQGPACARTCPTHAIVFGTKEEMKQHAAERIKDLKSRGYTNAGLYDPPGVGGHPCDVRPAARRQAGNLCRVAQRPEDQSGRRILEGADKICRHGHDGRLCGSRRFALSGLWPQQGSAEG